MFDVKDKILDFVVVFLVFGEEFVVDNSVCSLKVSKVFLEDVIDVGVGGSCIGNFGGVVGNDFSKVV